MSNEQQTDITRRIEDLRADLNAHTEQGDLPDSIPVNVRQMKKMLAIAELMKEKGGSKR